MRLSAIGDICHTIPVVRTLQLYWPKSEITWIIGKIEHSLVEDLPGVNFIIFDKSEGWSAYKKLKTNLQDKSFDLLLHLQESLRSSVATLLIKADVKLGFNKKDAQDFQWMFCNKQIDYVPRQHYMDRLLQFTDKLELVPPVLSWDIPVSAEDKDFVESKLTTQYPYIVISPCSSVVKNNWRNWTIDGYAEIADIAKNKYGMTVILTGGPNQREKSFGNEIQMKMKTDPLNVIGQLSLKQLLYLISKSRAVISPDSGPAHLATTVGVPAISLFATSNPNFTGAYKSKEWIVNKYPEALKKFNNKSVENARWGERVRSPDAMNLISVADVEEKIKLIANNTQH